ncbi:hypothetical protein STCU_02523 [Strigomonas culicis]|uniref:Uncharacterized protein n=1 Tax=Strigomonas culicis TaxID=28005 RepID=S9W0N3_9TRYP|nr:hypothetical protein STCU_08278 [Strigomonas culicis]EPY33031.1 hypothetical protein STCU_02523 [Strigomonas culicis]|eukprot:EPY22248.1 hypothetical protein STCU_08278 [Strigomonas culicis]
MMRRSFFLLSGSMIKSISDVGTHTSSKLKETEESVYTRVKLAYPEVDKYVPPASERPELLQVYVEPTPFINARRLQLFTISMGIGMTAVSVVYLILSKTISDNLEDQQQELDTLSEKNRAALVERKKMLDDFSAPSSYEELKLIVEQHDRELERNEKVIAESTSVLHTEVIYRLKMWWNRSLMNIQAATTQFYRQKEARLDKITEENIKSVIQSSGYDLLSLKVVQQRP